MATMRKFVVISNKCKIEAQKGKLLLLPTPPPSPTTTTKIAIIIMVHNIFALAINKGFRLIMIAPYNFVRMSQSRPG
jgi:hypothetical protein